MTMRSSNPALLEAALRHVAEGEWIVDVERGQITGRRFNRPLGSRKSRYVLLTVRLPDGREGGALFHRVVWAVAHGKTVFPELNHINGDKHDNRLANLEESNPRDNTRHAHATGLCAEGERHHNAKMTADNIRELRSLRADGWLLSDLASRYGVTKANVSYILKGKGWRHVA